MSNNLLDKSGFTSTPTGDTSTNGLSVKKPLTLKERFNQRKEFKGNENKTFKFTTEIDRLSSPSSDTLSYYSRKTNFFPWKDYNTTVRVVKINSASPEGNTGTTEYEISPWRASTKDRLEDIFGREVSTLSSYIPTAMTPQDIDTALSTQTLTAKYSVNTTKLGPGSGRKTYINNEFFIQKYEINLGISKQSKYVLTPHTLASESGIGLIKQTDQNNIPTSRLIVPQKGIELSGPLQSTVEDALYKTIDNPMDYTEPILKAKATMITYNTFKEIPTSILVKKQISNISRPIILKSIDPTATDAIRQFQIAMNQPNDGTNLILIIPTGQEKKYALFARFLTLLEVPFRVEDSTSTNTLIPNVLNFSEVNKLNTITVISSNFITFEAFFNGIDSLDYANDDNLDLIKTVFVETTSCNKSTYGADMFLCGLAHARECLESGDLKIMSVNNFLPQRIIGLATPTIQNFWGIFDSNTRFNEYTNYSLLYKYKMHTAVIVGLQIIKRSNLNSDMLSRTKDTKQLNSILNENFKIIFSTQLSESHFIQSVHGGRMDFSSYLFFNGIVSKKIERILNSTQFIDPDKQIARTKLTIPILYCYGNHSDSCNSIGAMIGRNLDIRLSVTRDGSLNGLPCFIDIAKQILFIGNGTKAKPYLLNNEFTFTISDKDGSFKGENQRDNLDIIMSLDNTRVGISIDEITLDNYVDLGATQRILNIQTKLSQMKPAVQTSKTEILTKTRNSALNGIYYLLSNVDDKTLRQELSNKLLGNLNPDMANIMSKIERYTIRKTKDKQEYKIICFHNGLESKQMDNFERWVVGDNYRSITIEFTEIPNLNIASQSMRLELEEDSFAEAYENQEKSFELLNKLTAEEILSPKINHEVEELSKKQTYHQNRIYLKNKKFINISNLPNYEITGELINKEGDISDNDLKLAIFSTIKRILKEGKLLTEFVIKNGNDENCTFFVLRKLNKSRNYIKHREKYDYQEKIIDQLQIENPYGLKFQQFCEIIIKMRLGGSILMRPKNYSHFSDHILNLTSRIPAEYIIVDVNGNHVMLVSDEFKLRLFEEIRKYCNSNNIVKGKKNNLNFIITDQDKLLFLDNISYIINKQSYDLKTSINFLVNTGYFKKLYVKYYNLPENNKFSVKDEYK